jgi:MOSC domain-containing protein YiiM
MTKVSQIGKVASLHLHPAIAGDPLQPVQEIHAEAGKGIEGDARVFGRKDRKGEPSRRQISIIGREQIADHASKLGLPGIAPGAVRSNIETEGIDLMALLGREVKVGGAVLLFYEARTPCAKMDLVAPGLRELMGNGKQGMMAQVVRSGVIKVGDEIATASVS